jgi:hypothetical protein
MLSSASSISSWRLLTSGALALALSGACGRHVIKVEADPGGAVLLVNGEPSKGDRWSTKDSLADVLATWPDGVQVRTKVTVLGDVLIRVRRDGDPSGLKAPILAASGPRGIAVIEGQPAVKGVGAAGSEGADDPFFAAVRALFAEAQRAYEFADYDLAITKFQEAYSKVRERESAETAGVLSNVLFNIAVVYEKSFELHPEVERLRKARIFYQQYDERMAAQVEGWAENAERAELLARIGALEARIAGLDKAK